MKIIKGEYSGFCTGVNLTYTKAKEILKDHSVYCLGEIIHNKQVVEELENLGMITVNSMEEVPDNKEVIIRAHGGCKEDYAYANKHNIKVIDLTCPKVSIVHNKVINHNDSYILLIGKKNHPEVIGTISYANNSYIIEDVDDIKSSFVKYKELKPSDIYIVCQTTFSKDRFNELVNLIKKEYIDCNVNIDNTICNSTENRQNEVNIMSKECSKMLVIGSKNSSNTKELYNISINNCKDTYFIENEDDVKKIHFDNNDVIGVVAGASAPLWLIDNIIALLNK